MKKIILFAIGILTLVNVLAGEHKYNKIIYQYDSSTHTAVLYNGRDCDAPEPEILNQFYVDGDPTPYVVTRISEEAFAKKDDNNNYINNTYIEYVVIPSTITTIEANAFYKCSNLRRIKFSGQISSIASNAFRDCSNLDYVCCMDPDANSNAVPLAMTGNNIKYLFIPEGSLHSNEGGYLNDSYKWKEKFGDRIFGGEMKKITASDGVEYVCAYRDGGNAILYKGNQASTVDVPVSSTCQEDGNNSMTFNVVGIGRPGFTDHSMQKLWLPESLKDISSGAFYNCKELVYIDLKQTEPLRFGPSVFPSNELISLFYPENVSSGYFGSLWENHQFGERRYRGNMKEETDAYGNKYLCQDKNNGIAILYQGVGNYDGSVTIKSSFTKSGRTYQVRNIGRYAFKGLTDYLKSLKIEDGIWIISNYAFQNCTSLYKLELPASLNTIGSNAFSGCSSLVHIYCKVEDPTYLSAANLPGNDANNMVTLYVPESLSSYYKENENEKWKSKFGDRIYEGEPIEVAKGGITYLYASLSHEATLFKGKDGVENVPSVIPDMNTDYTCNVTGIDKGAFSGSTIEKLIIPDGVTSIGPDAFRNCSSLKLLELPPSLKTIKRDAFNGCGNLINVVCKANTPPSIIDNVFNTKRILYVPTPYRSQYGQTTGWKNFTYILGGGLKEITPEGATTKYYCATGSNEAVLFSGDKTLTTVTIPSTIQDNVQTDKYYNVVAIEKSAFASSGSLVMLTIENGTKKLSIGENAFNSCTKLRFLTLPSNLSKIGKQAFYNCNNLEYIISKSSAPSELSTLDEVFPSSKGTLYVPTSYGSAYSAAGWNSFVSIVECDEMRIENHGLTYAFLKKGESETATVIKGLSTVAPDNGILVIPEKYENYAVVAIAPSAFSNNTNIKELRLHDGISTIGKFAFKGCANLATLSSLPSNSSLPSSLTTIEESTFEGTALTSLVIPSGVESIGASAFKDCNKIATLELPSSLTAIGTNAFDGCTAITTITSQIPGANLVSLCPNISNVFTSPISPTIYIPAEDTEYYTTHWGAKFVAVGTFVEGSFGEFTAPNGWHYEYINGVSKTATLITAPTIDETLENNNHLTIPSTITYNSVPYDITEIASAAFTVYPNKDNIDKLTISEKITRIGACAFQGYKNVKEIHLPSSLKTINEKAFDGCNAITYVCSKSESPTAIIDNVFSLSANNTATLFVPKGAEAHYTGGWRSKISNIVGGVFVGEYIDGAGDDLNMTFSCYTIDNEPYAILTKSLTSSKTVNISTTVTPGETVAGGPYTVAIIGKYAFQNRTAIEKVTLPVSITAIGDNAFVGCTNLTEVDSKIETPFEIQDKNRKFPGCATTLYVPQGTKDDYYTKNWNFDIVCVGARVEKKIDYLTYVYSEYGDEATIIKSDAANTSSTIPANVPGITVPGTQNKVKVIAIADAAFENNKSLQGVDIPENITKIGINAFKGCSSLKYVTLPASLETIGSGAFENCTKLTEVDSRKEVPINITDRKGNIFPNCVVSLYVPKGKRDEYYSAGWDFDIINNGARIEKTIGNITYVYAQYENTATIIKSNSENTNSDIPATVPGITVPETGEVVKVTAIAESAFEDNKLLPSLVIPENVTSIGANAFKGCTSIQVVTLPASLEDIGNGAFSGCSLLTDVDSRREIPIAITKSNIFPDCAVSLYVPKDKMSDYYNAGWGFAIRHNGKRIEETKDNITYLYAEYEPNATIIGSKVAVATLEIPANVPEVIIPGTTEDKVYVTSIAESAFSGNTNVESLKLPDELKTIGDYAFQNCSSLQRVWLPSKLTGIGAKAFNGCKSINRVSTKALPDIENKDVFPVNIEYLFIPESADVAGVPGWGSFHRTVKGEYIGDMTTSEDITYICMKNGEGEGTKRSAILWKSTNTPSSIESSVAYKGNTYEVTTIGEKVFSGKSFESLQLPNGITTIDADAFKGCKSLKTLELPSTLKTIGANAFNGCTALKYVELPSSLTSISKNAYDGCSNLTEVVCKITEADVITKNPLSLPYATLYVANNKDSYKKDLGWEYLHILEGDRKLWDAKNGLYYAYSTVDKKALLIDSKIEETDDDITIPGKITAKEDALAVTCDVIAIDKSVFSGNTNVKTVKIEDGIQTIGAYAFQGCSNLRLIELPNSLISIGEKAFEGCNNLTEVICNMGVENVNKINPQSLPNATLYVHEGTSGYYGEWTCAHIYEGARQVVPQDGLYYAYTKGAGETIVVGADISAGENITIPGSITIGEGESAENYAVVAINDEAFNGNTDIKSVKIGEKIQTIGANAFLGCTNLQKIWLPSTLTKIGEKAFDGCNSIAYICTSSKTPLESPNFSKNVFSSYSATLFVPDNDAESNYKSKDFWKSFTMKVGYLVDVKSQDNLIYECVTNGDVATATMVKSETTVEDVAIPSIIKLDNDTHEYKVTTISKQVFKGNSNIVTLKIGENVKAIEDEAFMNCGKLQKVWLPSTLESIGNKAFNGSKSITRVSTKTKTMPSLGSEVFSTSTAYLFVPKGTESSWSGFAKVVEGHYVGDVTTDNISYICIENGDAAEKSAMLIKAPKTASAFASSVVLDSETYPLTTICESAFEDNTALVNLVIPDGVKAIEANAFKNSTKLLTVELPASLEKIGDNAFQGCGLVYIQNLAETPVTISENVFTDAVYNNATLYVPDNASENYDVEVWKKFTIVEGVYSEVSIEGMTYLCVTSQDKLVARVTKGLSKTKEVKIPAKIFIGGLNYQVLSVEKSAFEGYNTLEKVIVAEGIKSIGEAVFKECTNLKSVVLPASLEAIGDYAFESCAGLETVTCAGETPVNINKNVFSVTKLEVNVPTRSSVSAYKEHTIWGAFEILYSMSSTSGSDGTENVDVATYQLVTPEGNDVTTTSVAIVDDDNVKGDFVIPTTVTRNGTPYTVTTIAPSAFEGNIELISVSLPPTVTSIGTGAFAGCENLQSMTVNNTVPPTLISTSTVASARRMFTRGADDSPIFKGVDVENCILYVPEESIEKYSQSDIWGVFKNIRAISATGFNGITISDGTPFDVYNLQGRKVKSGVTTLKGLTPGVYIVRGKKVAIR